MLIAIKSCERDWDRVSAIRDTWQGDSSLVYPFTGWQLDVPDDYAHLPAKTRAICRWLLRHDQDFGFLCDTDTYVSIPRLLASGYENWDYSGYPIESEILYASGGAGYWLSRRAMEVIAEHAKPELFKFEDEMVGVTLSEHGILLHNDSRYALYEDVLPDNSIISRHLSSREPFKIEFMYEAHRRANDSRP